MGKTLAFLSIAFLSLACYAGEISISQFGGLNTQDSTLAIDPSESPDLLNVRVTPGGKSVYKREGDVLYKSLPISTSAVHGIYYFQDTSGSDIHLYGSDNYLYGVVNGGSIVQLATGTLAATWQCTDSVGFAYCLTSSHDTAVRTSGTTGTTSFQTGIPLGTMVTITPDRLVVAGVSGNESTLYFSKSNTPTNHTIGPLNTDAFTEVINSPGSRITHTRYACGKVLWWKDTSFGYSVGSTQYDLENVVISPNVGTLDNSSDEYNGHVYFRGQDNHIYDYDCSNVTRLSRKITPTVSSAGRRRSNQWTQTSQSDFNSGTIVPSIQLSTTVSPGGITVSSFQANEYSGVSGWSVGSSSQMAVGTSSISLSMDSNSVLNNSFETGNVTNWTLTQSGSSGSSFTQSSADAQDGTKSLLLNAPGDGLTSNSIGPTLSVLDSAGNLLESPTLSGTLGTSWAQLSATLSNWKGHFIKLKFTVYKQTCTGDTCSSGQSGTATSDAFISNGSTAITFYAKSPDIHNCYIDLVGGTLRSSISSGSFTSQRYDTGFTSATWQISDFTYSVNTSTPVFSLLTATGTSGPWTQVLTATGTNVVSNRYAKFVSTISASAPDNSLTYLSSFTVLARSTGTYYSAVNNAPSLATWNTLTETDFINGASTITYYARSSTNSFTVLSSTPAWTVQQKNSLPTISTGTYFQLRADFKITAATETPSISDFTFNWFEGSASDKAYIKYWNDYVHIAVSSGTSGTNNRVFIWDLQNKAWLLDDITANGYLVDNGTLYFGSPTVGKIYKFGGVTTDESAAIASHWKSKNFVGTDPWVKNEYLSSDFIMKSASTTVTVAYQVDTTTATSYTLNLYDSVRSIVHRANNLPSGKLGNFYNFNLSDSSSNTAWELLGHRVRFNPLPWKTE